MQNEEYYEDRLSNCCGLPIFFLTDICIGCKEHSNYKIIKMNIELKSESLSFLEDMLIGQLELFEKENDEFYNEYCEKIKKVLIEIQEQL
tara:strand:+ start:136 stop:405 length:270 start_codon:yes stop_codon:yes gene_type:complete